MGPVGGIFRLYWGIGRCHRASPISNVAILSRYVLISGHLCAKRGVWLTECLNVAPLWCWWRPGAVAFRERTAPSLRVSGLRGFDTGAQDRPSSGGARI